MFGTRARIALLALALPLSSGAAADDETEAPIPSGVEEEVVVSATVARDRHDPAPFTDLDQDRIEAINVGQDLSTLLGETMNAYSYSDAGNGFGYSYLRIRGFDQSRVAININGVPLNTPESKQVYTIDLGDFATGLGLIQIQRGPGTALYGSAAVGGVVNLETAPLSTTAGGQLDLTAGSFGTYRASLRYGGPIGSSPWAWAVRAAHVASDGYRRPSWSRQTFASAEFERFSPDSVWRILLFGGPETTQLSYLGVPHDYLDDDDLRRTNFLREGETDTFVQPQLQVMNDRRLAPGLLLKNTIYAILGEGAFRQYTGTDWTKRALGNRQIGWIPRLSWRHHGGELAAGLELLVHRGRHDGKVEGTSQVLYDYTNEKDTANAFVRETLNVGTHATVSLELQATHHRFAMRKDRVQGISWDGTYAFLTPRVGANWNVSDRWNVYAQVTKTESEPSFTNVWNPEDPASDPASRFERFDPAMNRYSDPLAKPERLLGFDVGAGYARGAARLKVNLYAMDFEDEFVFAGGLDADGLPITKNAARSVHRGIEIEGAVRAPGDVDIAGYLAVSDDELRDEVVHSPDGAGGEFLIDYSGNRVALFPDRMARLSVGRTFGMVRAELSGRYVGTIYLDNSENERKAPANRAAPGYVDKRIDPYTLVGAQAVLDLSRWAKRPAGSFSARVRVDNLLDAKVAQLGYSYPLDPAYTQFYSEFFPAATRSVLVGLTFGF